MMLLGSLRVLHLAHVLHDGLNAAMTRIVAVTGLPVKTMEMDISRVCQAQALQPHQTPPNLLNQVPLNLLNQILPSLLYHLLPNLRMEMDAAPSIIRIALTGAARLMTLA